MAFFLENFKFMHISEGILSAPVLLSGASIATVGTCIGLKKLDYDRIPQVAILTSAFFIGSLVHVPIGPFNIHLILNGLMGIFLGWVAFPAILVGIILQALLFQYGGFTTLGINCINMALPAVICFYTFGAGIKSDKKFVSLTASFLCGFTAVFLSCIMLAFSLIFTNEGFLALAKLAFITQLPLMIIEGMITLFCVRFLKKVKPEILEVVYEV